MAKYTKEQIEQATEFLSKHIPAGTKVYTKIVHRSASGSTRTVAVYIVIDNEIQEISGYVARLTGYPINDKVYGIKVSGYGFDAGFDIVYALGSALFPDGFAIPEGQTGRNGNTSGFDKDGGYALKHITL